MVDEIYNRFKKELSRYHRKGWEMEYPTIEASYDEERQENIIYIQVGFMKKGKPIEDA